MRNKLLTKRNPVSHDVVTDAGQFVPQRFGCQAGIGLSYFAVIVPFELFIIPTAQLSGFGECPTQVTIPVFTVAIHFAFTIGQPLGWHTPAVGNKISDFGETAYITHLQHDGHGQDVTNTGDRQQLLEPFTEFDFLFLES